MSRPLSRPLLRELRRAMDSMAAGDPADGAHALSSIADRIADRMPVRAGFLRFEAGRAWAAAGEADEAEKMLTLGLTTLVEAGQTVRARHLAASAVRILEADGLRSTASHLRQQLPSLFTGPTPSGTDRSELERLPTKCPQCGATLKPSTLEQEQDGSMACAYCGSRVVPG